MFACLLNSSRAFFSAGHLRYRRLEDRYSSSAMESCAGERRQLSLHDLSRYDESLDHAKADYAITWDDIEVAAAHAGEPDSFVPATYSRNSHRNIPRDVRQWLVSSKNVDGSLCLETFEQIARDLGFSPYRTGMAIRKTHDYGVGLTLLAAKEMDTSLFLKFDRPPAPGIVLSYLQLLNVKLKLASISAERDSIVSLERLIPKKSLSSADVSRRLFAAGFDIQPGRGNRIKAAYVHPRRMSSKCLDATVTYANSTDVTEVRLSVLLPQPNRQDVVYYEKLIRDALIGSVKDGE